MTGTIPEAVGNLRYLERLFLGNNQLTGEVTRSLGNLRYLERVDLSENQLTGTVPAELGNLAPEHDRGYQGLVSLDLSRNELTGDIPRELTDSRERSTCGATRSPDVFRTNGKPA